MKSAVKRFGDRYFGRGLDFRVRLFNILAMAGVLLSLYSAAAAIPHSLLNVLICLAAAGLSYWLMWYATRTGRYELCYIITIVAIFFVLFPLLFFVDGGYDGAMVFIFVLAVLFTVFMLKGRKALVFAGVEILFYMGLFVLAYLHPEWVTGFAGPLPRLMDLCVGFVINCVAFVLCLYFHFKLYDQQQQTLDKQNAELARLNEQKGALLADVSHEIRTPLTVMSGYAQRARKQIEAGAVSEDTLQGLLTIQQEAQRLAELADQLLRAPMVEQNTALPGPVRPAEIMEQAAALARHILEKNGNCLTLQEDKNCPPVHANAGTIAQVLVNLCVNANRHTKRGEIAIVATPAPGGMVAFTVTDNGEGIDEALLPVIFMRGVSGDGKSGLGLAICKEAVEGHGGKISIESQPGMGTRVAFTLPQQREGACR